MKILVTGGAGFIGSCFIRHILNKYSNYKIINLDALTYCGNLDNLKDIENNPNYEFVLGNICDEIVVNNLISKVNVVVNFAAESHVDNSIKAPKIFFETNVLGTLNLLEVSKKFDIKRFIQISTDEVYGSIYDGYFDEKSQLAPNNPYAASKASADLLVRSYIKTYKLPAIITRSTNNYGPYQYPEKLIPFFISKLLKNEKVPIYGNGMQIRDWLYVYDHCEAIDLVIHKGKIGETYNIAGHNEKTNLEITKLILDAMNKDESFIEHTTDRFGHDWRYTLSNNKISSELGWSPKVSFEEGIKNTINWYLTNQNWIKNIEFKK